MTGDEKDRADAILNAHIPGRAAGSRILNTHLPHIPKANAILAGAPIRKPSGRPSAPVPKGTSPLAQAIADNAGAVKAGGGTIDINVWAADLQSRGVTSSVIVAAYRHAGGDAVLAPAEARGDTSAFLYAFVAALEAQGVPAEVILAAYHEAGGQAGIEGVGATGGGRHGGGMFGGGFGGSAGQAIKSVGDFIANPIGAIGKIFG